MRRAARAATFAAVAASFIAAVASAALATGRTLTFTATVTSVNVVVGPTSTETFTQKLTAHGRSAGSAALDCTNTATNQTCNVTYTLKGAFRHGAITATVNFPRSRTGKGNVTGGSGAYAGANGTITVKHADNVNRRYTVTIKLR